MSYLSEESIRKDIHCLWLALSHCNRQISNASQFIMNTEQHNYIMIDCAKLITSLVTIFDVLYKEINTKYNGQIDNILSNRLSELSNEINRLRLQLTHWSTDDVLTISFDNLHL